MNKDEITGTIIFIKNTSERELAEFIINLQNAVEGLRNNNKSYGEAYKKLLASQDTANSAAVAELEKKDALSNCKHCLEVGHKFCKTECVYSKYRWPKQPPCPSGSDNMSQAGPPSQEPSPQIKPILKKPFHMA